MAICKGHYGNHFYPVAVDPLDQSARSFGGLDGRLQDAVHVNVVTLDLIPGPDIRSGPTDEHALVQLALEGQLPGRRH